VVVVNLIFSVIVIGLLSHSIASAEVVTESVIVPKPASNIIYEDSSAFNRINKKYELDWHMVGFGPVSTTSSGVALGYHLDPDTVILIEGPKGNADGTSLQLFSRLDVKTTSFGVHLKRFSGNSFYIRAGIDYRTLEYQSTYSGILSSDSGSSYQFSSTSLSLSGAIGNQWQWENFTLGCDWVGYSQPLSSTVTNEQASYGKYSSDNTTNNNEAKARYVASGSVQLLRFYIGASF
jgi:hypothetical protein